MKSGIVQVSDDDNSGGAATLPISEWSYTTERGVRHVGPMAQDFFAAFNVGEDDRHITSIDEDGVALAAIKALDALARQRDLATKSELACKDAEIGNLRAQMNARDAALQRQMSTLVAEMTVGAAEPPQVGWGSHVRARAGVQAGNRTPGFNDRESARFGGCLESRRRVANRLPKGRGP